MIHPQKNRFILWFMDKYVRWLIGRYFHRVNYNQVTIDQARSVLLIANHTSIWDGLLLYWLNNRALKKNFHVMIMEATLRKEVFLRYGGAFSVNRNSKDIVRSLTFAADLLANPGNLVLIFPQGKLYSGFIDQMIFEKGVFKVMEKARGNFQIVFAANFTECFQHKRLTANISLKQTSENFADLASLQQAYQQHYDEAKLQQSKIVV